MQDPARATSDELCRAVSSRVRVSRTRRQSAGGNNITPILSGPEDQDVFGAFVWWKALTYSQGIGCRQRALFASLSRKRSVSVTASDHSPDQGDESTSIRSEPVQEPFLQASHLTEWENKAKRTPKKATSRPNTSTKRIRNAGGTQVLQVSLTWKRPAPGSMHPRGDDRNLPYLQGMQCGLL